MIRVLSFSFLLLLQWPPASDAKVTRYLTGNRGDVEPAMHGPAHDFAGGGEDIDAGIQWMIDRVRGCSDCSIKLDVVVLRASGGAGYNDYMFKMNGVDSIETLVITSRRDSNRPDMESTLRKAEVIFFAGGDQCNYVRYFKGTAIERAVESVYNRGGGIGGTSAGLAILSDYVYDACGGSAVSNEALADPYNKSISFTYDFFRFENMQSTIADQHLVTRDRLGRTLVFVARLLRDGKAGKNVMSVAVNEETSLVVDKNGVGTVLGKGPVYFVLGDHVPELCEPKKPVTFSNYKIWKVPAGGTFDLRNRPTTGYYLRSILNGKIDSDPY
jgi:cyanophycinase